MAAKKKSADAGAPKAVNDHDDDVAVGDEEAPPPAPAPAPKVATKPKIVIRDEGPRRVTGPPLLALLADSAWSAAVGGEAELGFKLANRGGAIKGIYVEVGGPGAAQVKAVSVEAHGAKVPFSGTRAELKELALEAAFEVDSNKKAPPPPTIEPRRVVVTIRGEKAGAALLTIRVGPIGATGTNGSALQGKTVTIT